MGGEEAVNRERLAQEIKRSLFKAPDIQSHSSEAKSGGIPGESDLEAACYRLEEAIAKSQRITKRDLEM